MNTKVGWGIVAGLGIASVAAVLLQARTTAAIRPELAASAGEVTAARRLRADIDQLRALQEKPAFSEGASEAALEQARTELADLRRRLEVKMPSGADTPTTGLTITRRTAIAGLKNAGAGSPLAALETALWAAAGGDADAFAALVLLDARGRRAANTLRESLPAEARARYGSAERLIASLTIPEVPLGFVEVRALSPGGPGDIRVASVIIEGPEGKMKQAQLPLIQWAEGWKLIVTADVVEKYATQLRGTAAVSGK